MAQAEAQIARNETNSWMVRDPGFAACLILAVAFLLRLWIAYGTFLNPDEALHYRVANKASLELAYEASLTTAHPPLLVLFLYFWRKLGVSELWLRFPSVLAGTLFCWIFHMWLSRRFDRQTGFIGLIFASFLPPLIALSAEVRQYAFLLLFMSAAMHLLEVALDGNSVPCMLVSMACVYLAMLTHYSALLFTAALGIYALWRILERWPKTGVVFAWAAGQVGAVAIFGFLYATHIYRWKANGGATATIEGWMRNSFYHSGRDNLLLFVIARTFGVFQYVFGQLAVGDVACLLFVAGILFLVRKQQAHAIAAFLALPFLLACATAIAGLYPYGGTRHSSFLAPFAIAGVSLMLSSMRSRYLSGATLSLVIVLLATTFGKPHRPYMLREDQSRERMDAAISAIHTQTPTGAVIFMDPQTSLQLGHYLCEQKLTPRDTSIAGFESYRCGGYHVITPSGNVMIFDPPTFLQQWNQMIRSFTLSNGEKVWVVQAGWDVALARDLSKLTEFRYLAPQWFGRNISMFDLTVGQPLPSVAEGQNQ